MPGNSSSMVTNIPHKTLIIEETVVYISGGEQEYGNSVYFILFSVNLKLL